jgi:predicted transcriptional regulator
MDTWETIRIRCRRDGEKIKVVARELGLAPNTVRKYLRQDGPPKRVARPRARLLEIVSRGVVYE